MRATSWWGGGSSDYPAFDASATRMAQEFRLPTTGKAERGKIRFAPNCADDKIASGLSSHRITLSVADRPFLPEDQAPDPLRFDSVPAEGFVVRATWILNLDVVPSALTEAYRYHLAWSFARWRRCSSVEYVEYSPSSRLAIARNPRRQLVALDSGQSTSTPQGVWTIPRAHLVASKHSPALRRRALLAGSPLSRGRGLYSLPRSLCPLAAKHSPQEFRQYRKLVSWTILFIIAFGSVYLMVVGGGWAVPTPPCDFPSVAKSARRFPRPR